MNPERYDAKGDDESNGKYSPSSAINSSICEFVAELIRLEEEMPLIVSPVDVLIFVVVDDTAP